MRRGKGLQVKGRGWEGRGKRSRLGGEGTKVEGERRDGKAGGSGGMAKAGVQRRREEIEVWVGDARVRDKGGARKQRLA